MISVLRKSQGEIAWLLVSHNNTRHGKCRRSNEPKQIASLRLPYGCKPIEEAQSHASYMNAGSAPKKTALEKISISTQLVAQQIELERRNDVS